MRESRCGKWIWRWVVLVCPLAMVGCPFRSIDGMSDQGRTEAISASQGVYDGVSVEPVMHTFWAEGQEEQVEPGISLGYADLEYRTDAKNQAVIGPNPHWTILFNGRLIEATRYPVFRIQIDDVERIGFWWVREDDLNVPETGLLSTKRYMETVAKEPGVFVINPSKISEWSGNIVMIGISPYVGPGKSFTLRSIQGWLGNGKWVTPKASISDRAVFTPSDNALGAFYYATAVRAFPYGTGALTNAEKRPWSETEWDAVRDRGLAAFQACLEQKDSAKALVFLSVLGRTSPSPIDFLVQAVADLSPETRRALWQDRAPFIVLKEFNGGEADAFVWINHSKRAIEKAMIAPDQGMNGGPCLRIRYAAPAATGDAMMALPVRIPLKDRKIGIRAFMKAKHPDEALGFINVAKYEDLNTSGWIGRCRLQETVDGWGVYTREDNFYATGAKLSEKDISELGRVTITNMLIPLTGTENELLIDRTELYLPE